ncbi:MAG: chromophore lyase CpcT/CpeT [Rhodothermales bacterium]
MKALTVLATFALSTLTVHAQDLDTLAGWMTGSFSSAAQAEADSVNYFDIRLEMVRIWPDAKDGIWLYVEQASASALDRPYRQRIYRVSEVEKSFTSAVYTFDEPLTLAGVWRTPEAFARLSPADLTEREGCAVHLMWDGEAYTGSTHEAECSSNLRGASYATSVVTVQADRIVSWDQGFDAKGDQVWGAEHGGYVFLRKHAP